MKNNLIILLTLFCISQIQCGVIQNFNIIQHGKLKIYIVGDILYCGSIECPISAKCIITQKNDPSDNTKLITKEKCFNNNYTLLNSNEVIETAEAYQHQVNLRIEGNPNGFSMITRELTDEEIQQNNEERAKRLQDRMEEIRLRNEEREKRLEERQMERDQRLADRANERAMRDIERNTNIQNRMDELRNRLEKQRLRILDE